ncbi:MAG: T9SS type A sorting domain-containing protein [Flavobacteriales bacterium]|nr:T9SS type A sorting domain-containing protein [Flavobacteriales bacterium]
MKFSLPHAIALLSFFLIMNARTAAQCAEGQITLSMNIYTDPWGYETYWELVPGTNACGDGTMAWGSNLEAVGCTGGGEQNAYGTETSYPSNTIVVVDNICLTPGEYYTLYFVDDWGDGGLYFELFEDGVFSGLLAGSGIGNTWTFQAGYSYLGDHDSPCNAVEVFPGVASAIDLNNINCYAQVAEPQPPQGNCLAAGVWCPDEVNHTVWAKFTVPDEGAYEISTVNNGTIINTQMAVWVAEDCSDMSSFIYISGNDNYMGESNVPVCGANPPACVDQGSAAFLNVINTYPSCCETGWDDACQALYDSMSETCAIQPQTCDFILEGYDSYGDGWNGCYVIVTIDGVSTNYSLTEGNYTLWTLPVTSGSQLSIEFVAADWPEEVYVVLKHPDGVPLLFVQAITVDPLLFDDVVSCNGFPWVNPLASRCYTHCLPAGVVCYIQIDGYDNESGQMVLSVKPYNQAPVTDEVIQNVLCPVGVGTDPEGMILPNVIGWGLNYSTAWTGPNGFESSAYFLESLPPGTYSYHAEDACGNVIDEDFVVEGPDPFVMNGSSTPTCLDFMDGSVSFTASGGTAPYSFEWMYPDSTFHDGVDQTNLAAGTYELVFQDVNGCMMILPVTVENFPEPEFTLGEDLDVCEDFDLMLSGPPGLEYMWSTGSQEQSLIISGDEYEVGVHTFTLTVTNDDGCTYTDMIEIEVTECVNVDEMNASEIRMYPTPANTTLNIVSLPESGEWISVMDLTGQVVYRENIMKKKSLLLNTEQWSSGAYVLSVMCADQVFTRQFSIIH